MYPSPQAQRDAQEMMQPTYVLEDFVELGVVLVRHGENPFQPAERGALYHRDDDGSSADSMLVVRMGRDGGEATDRHDYASPRLHPAFRRRLHWRRAAPSPRMRPATPTPLPSLRCVAAAAAPFSLLHSLCVCMCARTPSHAWPCPHPRPSFAAHAYAGERASPVGGGVARGGTGRSGGRLLVCLLSTEPRAAEGRGGLPRHRQSRACACCCAYVGRRPLTAGIGSGSGC